MTNISTLKSLTQTTFDSVEGYRKAVDKADSPALKDALNRRLTSREQTLSKLNSALESNGEERITSSSMTASTHQTFMSIADSFENGNEAAVERVEEGEDYIAGQFRDALEDDDLDASFRSLIQQTYQEISEGERFSDMLEKQYA
ncbi:hypothetical protein CD351_08065 [Erythrobacter sp. KY5]|uniref:PA2169 family four-helix-bundle protein n=1 Tax=Erythrobacter sp. KY5 TaxID=2011159 RepID=UPI000DBEF932|nr:PA2169 family four-helix-bundle protein [Erythrobacter sp. KY5]AWW74379.1 hypothetical protein CD351_08065 [Erythrobacter sp. KY5]